MARKGQSAAFLKRLRKRYKLGEYAKKPKKRPTTKNPFTGKQTTITKKWEPDPHKRKVLQYYESLGIKDIVKSSD